MRGYRHSRHTRRPRSLSAAVRHWLVMNQGFVVLLAVLFVGTSAFMALRAQGVFETYAADTLSTLSSFKAKHEERRASLGQGDRTIPAPPHS